MLEVNGSVLKFKNGASQQKIMNKIKFFILNKATDLDGLTYEQEFNLSITNDTSDDPKSLIDIDPSSNQIYQHSVSGTPVGVTASVPNSSNGDYTYSILIENVSKIIASNGAYSLIQDDGSVLHGEIMEVILMQVMLCLNLMVQ